MGLKQGSLESNLWTIHQVREGVEPESSSPEDFDPAIQGYLLVYVDDLLFLGPVGVTEFLHQKISSIWECSKLKFAHNRLDDEPLRFLGIEIKTCEGGFLLTQEAYISELLRAHEVNPSKRSKVPAPKEWLRVMQIMPPMSQLSGPLSGMLASCYGLLNEQDLISNTRLP